MSQYGYYVNYTCPRCASSPHKKTRYPLRVISVEDNQYLSTENIFRHMILDNRIGEMYYRGGDKGE